MIFLKYLKIFFSLRNLQEKVMFIGNSLEIHRELVGKSLEIRWKSNEFPLEIHRKYGVCVVVYSGVYSVVVLVWWCIV